MFMGIFYKKCDPFCVHLQWGKSFEEGLHFLQVILLLLNSLPASVVC